ncbi:GyrI-like domain-containing protein [Corynebacterium freiburgense]|uniref:GyrI-like domain-containing protein n=1 Tax=Corynebacterium freiburgense TaxID=556548 RepID=UPI0004151827|nr:GyrI-like domain-containing protein [Corynebacterium freiburgense]WJZ01672.1 Bacterial transcription activator, effector binding domain [Corynebacterium freiburgense]
MSIVISQATVEPMNIVALTGVVPTYAEEFHLWEKMFPLVSEIPLVGPFASGVIEHDAEFVARNPEISVFLPVAEGTQVDSPLELYHFPARECLVADIRGPYSQITAAHEQLGEYLAANNLSPRTDDTIAAKCFTLYCNTPDEVDESELLTRVCIPLS